MPICLWVTNIAMYSVKEKILFVQELLNGIGILMIYIFLGDKNDVQEFVSILNNFDENLEFTLEINLSRVHFLDIKK